MHSTDHVGGDCIKPNYFPPFIFPLSQLIYLFCQLCGNHDHIHYWLLFFGHFYSCSVIQCPPGDTSTYLYTAIQIFYICIGVCYNASCTLATFWNWA